MRLARLVPISSLLAFSWVAHAAEPKIAPVLGPKAVATLGQPIGFDVGDSGAIVIQTKDNVYDVGKGAFLFREPLKELAALTMIGDLVSFVEGGALSLLKDGKKQLLIRIPLQEVKLAGSTRNIFVYGVPASGTPAMFLFEQGLVYYKLLDLPAPVDAMARAGDALFCAIGPQI